ncbi:hypothetical protein [Burkholderia sp. S-53]|uniref:hypothetical protein n=1 Tax=Burkholderia sp. S-53 TaxID=2906514 RepID=UPI0021D035E3|nr:hypothetical protein [Burkholderia sp. S-53]UXU88888.1 hypothetical protein LXM88_10645 [Burkholderia sp. S-53]
MDSATGWLGVLCVEAFNDIRISYINPGATISISKTVQITGGLESGTRFRGQVKLVLNEEGFFEAFALDEKGRMWHATETQFGFWKGGWDSSPIGTGFETKVSEFKVISIGGGQGPYQVVALKADGNVYQATQTAVGKYDAFVVAGAFSHIGKQPKFSGSPAAIFDPANSGAVYAAYNTSPSSGVNDLYYCAYTATGGSGIGSASGYWQPEESTYPDYAPAAGDSIVLTATMDNDTQLFWMNGSGQVYSVSRKINNGTNYWPAGIPDLVGQAKSSFTGAIASAVNGPNVGLFQSSPDGGIWFINYLPSDN